MYFRRDTVILNVGGIKHQVKWETIEKFPKSRLHNLRFAITEGKCCYKYRMIMPSSKSLIELKVSYKKSKFKLSSEV